MLVLCTFTAPVLGWLGFSPAGFRWLQLSVFLQRPALAGSRIFLGSF